jgi:uncharacterized protein
LTSGYRSRVMALRWAALLFALWLPLAALAQSVQAVPPLTAHVMDQTGTLNAAQLQALEAKLTTFEKARGAQVVVLMLPTTAPEDIAAYAQRVGDSWKIGRKSIGDGLLLVVAKNDRQVRIETTKALEGAIPDLAARQIIDSALTPRFKQGDFAGGLDAAADQIIALITGEKLPAPAGTQDTKGFNWMDLAVFLFFAVPIGARVISSAVGRKVGSLVTGGAVGLLAWIFTSSLLIAGIAALVGMVFALISSLGALGSGGRSSGWGGIGGGHGRGGSWGGGGGGGGGFSSGGGGDFGGGGASGRW